MALLVGTATTVVVLARFAQDESPAAVPTTTTTSSTTTLPPTTTVPPTTTTLPFDVSVLRPPAPAGDSAGLAAQILAAETTLRDPDTRGPRRSAPPRWPSRSPTGSSATTPSGRARCWPRSRRSCTRR